MTKARPVRMRLLTHRETQSPCRMGHRLCLSVQIAHARCDAEDADAGAARDVHRGNDVLVRGARVAGDLNDLFRPSTVDAQESVARFGLGDGTLVDAICRSGAHLEHDRRRARARTRAGRGELAVDCRADADTHRDEDDQQYEHDVEHWCDVHLRDGDRLSIICHEWLPLALPPRYSDSI